jgi:MFS family permease
MLRHPATLRAGVTGALERRGRYPSAVLLVALSGLFATTFPVTILTLALPTMAEDFGTDEATLAWVVTLPMIVSALALPVLGKMGDLHGHRRVFIAGCGLAVVFSAVSATATNAALLIAWRTLAQVAGTSTMPSSLALITSTHHGRRRAKALGWWSMIAAGAPVVGLTVGAPAIDAFGWPTLFLMQAGLMAVPVVAAWVVLRETPTAPARFDLPGAALLALGVGPLLLAASEARQWGIVAPPTLACVALAGVGLLAFRAVERRSPEPLIPPALLRERQTTSILAVSLLTGASYMGGFFIASLLVVEQFGYSLTSAVPILSIRPVLFAVMSPVGGWVTGRAGSRGSALAGCLALTGGLAGLAIGSAADSLVTVVLAGFVLQGTGYGLLRPALSTALADAVDERDLGVAGATERLVGQLGVVFGITIMAALYASETDRFPLAFAVGAAFAGLATVGSLRMAGPRAHAGSDRAPVDGALLAAPVTPDDSPHRVVRR